MNQRASTSSRSAKASRPTTKGLPAARKTTAKKPAAKKRPTLRELNKYITANYDELIAKAIANTRELTGRDRL